MLKVALLALSLHGVPVPKPGAGFLDAILGTGEARMTVRQVLSHAGTGNMLFAATVPLAIGLAIAPLVVHPRVVEGPAAPPPQTSAQGSNGQAKANGSATSKGTGNANVPNSLGNANVPNSLGSTGKENSQASTGKENSPASTGKANSQGSTNTLPLQQVPTVTEDGKKIGTVQDKPSNTQETNTQLPPQKPQMDTPYIPWSESATDTSTAIDNTFDVNTPPRNTPVLGTDVGNPLDFRTPPRHTPSPAPILQDTGSGPVDLNDGQNSWRNGIDTSESVGFSGSPKLF